MAMHPFEIVIDTREQQPWAFNAETPVSRHALPAGDYSLRGYETAISIERKSKEDFVSTVIKARRRFHSELALLQAYVAPIIVVECTYSEILQGQYRCSAHPNAVAGATLSIIVDYGIQVFFAGDRQCAARFALDYLTRWHGQIDARIEQRTNDQIALLENATIHTHVIQPLDVIS